MNRANIKTPVEALEDDELYRILKSGEATTEDCRAAAIWIRRLTAILTPQQDQRLRDGYDVGDQVDPEISGMMLAALCNAISDRMVSLSQSLSPLMSPTERTKTSLEIRLLADLYPKGRAP